MFQKIKKLLLAISTLVVVLIIIAVISSGLAIYFGIKTATLKKEFIEIGPKEKLEKIHSYAVTLEKFEDFKRKPGEANITTKLEMAVLVTGNGVLKNLFDEMVLGDNLEKDMDYFLDAIIDSLKFFSISK